MCSREVNSSASPPDLRAALKEHFGFPSFLPGQEETILHTLNGDDSIVIMPTGKGKSLCYQLTALLMDGVTVVVSPLIALMKDQVDGLLARGLPATFINSSLTWQEMAHRIREMERGSYKLVYVAPERFRSRRFLEVLRNCRVSLLAVDEAHCISHWGHDFRPEYLRLGTVLTQFPQARAMALTATATPYVREDIMQQLGLGREGRAEPRFLVFGLARPNLRLLVSRTANHQAKLDRVIEILDEWESGIVYCATRKQAEKVHSLLRDAGRKAGLYHAGLRDRERQAIQDRFMGKEIPVVVATNAFGMGVDRTDLRFVVHWDLPGSVEAYYQEIGRAGRDGSPALCDLLYNYADVRTQEFFLDAANPEPFLLERTWRVLQRSCSREESRIQSLRAWTREISPEASDLSIRTLFSLLERSELIRQEPAPGGQIEISLLEGAGRVRLDREASYLVEKRRRDRKKLRDLLGYVNSTRCRHGYILGYFGDNEAADECDNCDRCRRFSTGEIREPTEEEWVVLQKALSCVTRMHGRFGLAKVLQVLRGSKAQEIMDRGLDRLSTHGLLKSHGQTYLRAIMEELIRDGCVRVSSGEYPVISITSRGKRVMLRQDPVELSWPVPPRKRAKPKARAAAPVTDDLTHDEVLFQNLRSWRTNRAREAQIPPYTVLHDATLKLLAAVRPRRLSELESIKGMGPAKIGRYGEELLEIVAADIRRRRRRRPPDPRPRFDGRGSRRRSTRTVSGWPTSPVPGRPSDHPGKEAEPDSGWPSGGHPCGSLPPFGPGWKPPGPDDHRRRPGKASRPGRSGRWRPPPPLLPPPCRCRGAVRPG